MFGNWILNRARRGVTRFSVTAAWLFIGIAAATSAALGDEPRLELEYVPPDATTVLSVRAADLAGQPQLQDLVRVIDQMAPVLAETKLSVRDFREVLHIQYGLRSCKRVVIRFVDAAQQTKFLDAMERSHKMTRAPTATDWQGDGEKFVQIDPTTVVWDQTTANGKSLAALKNSPPPWAQAWQERSNQAVVIAANPRTLLQTYPFRRHEMGDYTFQMFHPLYYKVEWVVGGVEVGDKPQLSGIAKCDSEKSVANVRDTLQALGVALQNTARLMAMAQTQRPDGNPNKGPQVELRKKAYEIAANTLASAQAKTDAAAVRISLESSVSTADLAALGVSFAPAVGQARAAARQAQSLNNLKQIALAMLNYENARKQLPPASSYRYYAKGKWQQSKYPHSWRVAIMPYLEEQALAYQYHFDEPWDSEANKEILARMPAVFRSAQDPDPKSTNTSYFVFTGPGAIFEGEAGTKLRTIEDGTSKTVLLVEAKQPVPWTKPEDISYEADKPLPKLAGWSPDRLLMAMADGSVTTVSADVDEELLRAHITRNGKEVVRWLPSPGEKQ